MSVTRLGLSGFPRGSLEETPVNPRSTANVSRLGLSGVPRGTLDAAVSPGNAISVKRASISITAYQAIIGSGLAGVIQCKTAQILITGQQCDIIGTPIVPPEQRMATRKGRFLTNNKTLRRYG